MKLLSPTVLSLVTSLVAGACVPMECLTAPDCEAIAPPNGIPVNIVNNSRAKTKFLWGHNESVVLMPKKQVNITLDTPGLGAQVFFIADPMEFVAVPASVGCIFNGRDGFQVAYYGSRMTCDAG